mgnify:CR=1 FL=1
MTGPVPETVEDEAEELGLTVPAPESVVFVTLRAAAGVVAAVSLPELLEFSWLVPEVEPGSESAEAIAPLMALIRSAVVIKDTAASWWLRGMNMSISSQPSFGVSC